jgi:hypothetical protein
MARFEKIIDLYFSDDGDFSLGQNGDLEDTQTYAYRGFMQRVLTRLMSKRREWALQPHLGADVVPVNRYEIAIVILINPPRSEGSIVLTFSYDIRNNRLIPRSL